MVLPVLLVSLAGLVGIYAFSGGRSWPKQAPEQAGAAFITELAAHHFDSARQALSSSLREEISLERLAFLAASLDAHGPGIYRVSGDTSSAIGGRASARVIIQMNDGHKYAVNLLMVREEGTWKVYNFRDFLRVAYPDRPALEILAS